MIFTTKAVALHSFPSSFSNSIISSIVHLLHQRLQAVEALLEAVPPEVAPGEAVPVQWAVQSKLVLVAVKSWSSVLVLLMVVSPISTAPFSAAALSTWVVVVVAVHSRRPAKRLEPPGKEIRDDGIVNQKNGVKPVLRPQQLKGRIGQRLNRRVEAEAKRGGRP